MANNTQFKHRSNNQQSGSKNKKNHQTGNNKKKSYMRTNPKPQEKEENRLKRVSEKNQTHDGNKGSENGKSPNQSNSGNGNSSSMQADNGNGKPSSNQSKNSNGKKRAYESGRNSSNQNPDSGAKASGDHEVKHKEQSGKFETAFNRIHKALKEMVKGTDSDAFVELLYSGYKNHSLVRKYKSELHQFAKLRNAIVHERVNADYYIAEPHIEVVERIEEIAREFEKPQTALSIATCPVFYYYEDAYLKDVLKVINKFDFTRFPVYDKDDKYIALLTSTEIIQWMAKHFSDSVVHFEDVRVKELLTKGKNYFVTFVDEDASLYHIEELFERYHTRGKKLQAVIITETGDRHGKPIGVITPWDLLDSDPED
ncbi:CBS domain-containing protein [Mesobacillus boroniphilus]|nr:CBS domain-containing protein [Mesobacillus boroniphilus]